MSMAFEAPTFEVSVSNNGESCVVSVAGELDFFTAPQLRERILDLVNQGKREVIVDMSAVTFIDSSGLGVLVAGLKRLNESGGKLVLRSPSRRTSRVLEVSGLSQVLVVA